MYKITFSSPSGHDCTKLETLAVRGLVEEKTRFSPGSARGLETRLLEQGFRRGYHSCVIPVCVKWRYEIDQKKIAQGANAL